MIDYVLERRRIRNTGCFFRHAREVDEVSLTSLLLEISASEVWPYGRIPGTASQFDRLRWFQHKTVAVQSHAHTTKSAIRQEWPDPGHVCAHS